MAISPFERQRNKALAVDDVPQVLSVAFTYDLPFGAGRRFLNSGGLVNKVVGGWTLSSVFRASSGMPFYFRSSNCNVPGQFEAACIPAILPGANPFAQDKAHFDPNHALFNASAFENSGPQGFQFDFGHGPAISDLRGFGYHNQDLSLMKTTHITERFSVEFDAGFFNVWNWHIFSCTNGCFGDNAFLTDIASPSFGVWDGSVTPPRNIQFALKVRF